MHIHKNINTKDIHVFAKYRYTKYRHKMQKYKIHTYKIHTYKRHRPTYKCNLTNKYTYIMYT